MPDNELEVTPQQVREWYRDDVAPALQALLDDLPDRMPPHLTPENGVKVVYVAKHVLYLDEENISYPDGSNDGGIDIFEEDRDPETDGPRFHVVQVHCPDLTNMAAGRFSGREVKNKFREDATSLINTLLGKKGRNLNETAQECVRRMQDAIHEADHGEGPPVKIVVEPVSIQRVGKEAITELESVREKLTRELQAHSNKASLEIREPLTPQQLIYRMRPQRTPKQVKLLVKGTPASAASSKGPHLAFARAQTVVDAYDTYRDRLLDANLRHWLKERTVVNKDIVRELDLTHPTSLKTFHLKNNGLVVYTKGYRYIESEQAIVLSDPQIINGGQTVVTMFHVRNRIGSESSTDPRVKEWRQSFNEDLLVPLKIIVDGPRVDIDAIAIASNSQNPMSPRTMKSNHPAMRKLPKRLAAVTPPWFLEVKDGEWEALKSEKNQKLLQSRTDRRAQAFKVQGSTGLRKLSNEDMGLSLLAFYGFPRSAKKSILWSEVGFRTAFEKRIKDDGWRELAGDVRWGTPGLARLLEGGQPGAHQYMLAYLVWMYWRRNTLPESQYLVLAFNERASRDERFEKLYFEPKKGTWRLDAITDEEIDITKKNQESCYWRERIAKAGYLVLVFQTMRILCKRYGQLTDETCRLILDLPQFRDMLSTGQVTPQTIPDLRTESLASGPLILITKSLLHACEVLNTSHHDRISGLLSPQQELLKDDWITRFTDAVDGVLNRLTSAQFRMNSGLDPDGSLADARSLEELLPPLTD